LRKMKTTFSTLTLIHPSQSGGVRPLLEDIDNLLFQSFSPEPSPGTQAPGRIGRM
jgi:hypothetical protein